MTISAASPRSRRIRPGWRLLAGTSTIGGREADFYTRIRGRHQLLDDGTLVISSPQQGRAFEVDPKGEVVVDLVNTKPGSEDFNYTISELRWLPQDFFDVEDWSCPIAN